MRSIIVQNNVVSKDHVSLLEQAQSPNFELFAVGDRSTLEFELEVRLNAFTDGEVDVVTPPPSRVLDGLGVDIKRPDIVEWKERECVIWTC